MGKRRKLSDIQQINAALDTISAELATESGTNKYHLLPGGEFHLRFDQWMDDHPDLDTGKSRRNYAEMQRWDKAKKPQISKGGGQGVLGFYWPAGHLPCDVNDPGARVAFKDCGPQEWDGWWEVEIKEDDAHRVAMRTKEDIYRTVRWAWRGPNDKMDALMREVFHWTEEMSDDDNEDLDDAAD